jgi:putative sporulation protein YyaC
MVGSANMYNGMATHNIKNREELTAALMSTIPCNLTNDDVVFVCIGTDRLTGDSLGPLVGIFLCELGYENVIGTINDPVHAVNLHERLREIESGKIVIAIDASLGGVDSVGTYSVIHGSIKPGAGLNKDLGEVGDYSIVGVVNVGGYMEHFVLANTRLSVVMRMARDIVDAICDVFPLVDCGHVYSTNDDICVGEVV